MAYLTDKKQSHLSGGGQTPKAKAVRRGFRPDKSGTFGATPAELVDFIREGNGKKVLHKGAVVKTKVEVVLK